MPSPPSALAAVVLSDTTFIFYVNSSGNVGYTTGPAAAANINDQVHFADARQIQVDGSALHVIDGFEYVGAIAYNNTQLRVYYVGKNPKNAKKNIVREIVSDDLGKTWGYGALGGPNNGKLYTVMQGSGLNATVLPGKEPGKFELRVYFTSDDSASLAVAWMPLDKDHAGDWNLAEHLYSIDRAW